MNFYVYNGSFRLPEGFNASYVLTLPADAPYASVRNADGMYSVTKAGCLETCRLEDVGHVFFPRVDFGTIAHVAFFRGFHEKVVWALSYLDQGVSEASTNLAIPFPVLQNVQKFLSLWQVKNHRPPLPRPGTYTEHTSWMVGLVKAAEKSLYAQHELAMDQLRVPPRPHWYASSRRDTAYRIPVIRGS